jgi:hypothetical protein
MINTFGNLLKNDREAFIVNTDHTSGTGIHWITIMPIDDRVFIVDSLGQNNVRPYDNIMFSTFANAGLEPVFYRGRFQWDNDSLCGWFAIYVTKMLNDNAKGISVPIANKLISNTFGHTADDHDVKILINAFGLQN